MSAFSDHFSGQSAGYARFRPHYPEGLFEFLASEAPARHAAWDCATGNGQVAEGLSPRFEQVYATDASEEQIRHAPARANVSYRVEPAEICSLEDRSVDLVSVGQALHWLDLHRFYNEVRRVARPDALVVAWCYNLLSCDAEVDRVIREFYRNVVGPYWPPERVFVERGYRDLSFPFAPAPVPEFALEADWNLSQLLGYLGTWSASAGYRRARGEEPTEAIAGALSAAWGLPADRRRIKWPLHFLAGRA